MVIWILLIAHVIVCVIFMFLKKAEGMGDRFPAVMVICLPGTGIAMWLADRYLIRNHLDNVKSPDLEKLKVTDARYRKLEAQDTGRQEQAVPLEEALVMNDTKLRRELMLDILHKNPEEYLDLLKKAGAGSDVEVTHYATTALSEIQGSYELEIQKRAEEYRRDPESMERIINYKEVLADYVRSGLLTGTVLRMQRRNLAEVLEKLMARNPDKENLFLYIEQVLELKEYDKAKEALKGFETLFGREEGWYRLSVRCAWELGDRARMDGLLNSVREEGVYLTREGKKWFAFWSGEETGRNTL